MCLSNEGLSHQETSEMVRQVRLGRAIGEMYVAAQGINSRAQEKACDLMTITWEASELEIQRMVWRAFGFNAIMKKYQLKVRA